MIENTIYKSYITTPIGELLACVSSLGVCMLDFYDNEQTEIELDKLKKCFQASIVEEKTPLFLELEKQLKAYFSKQITEFNLPLDLRGTDFQQRVWESLLNIPYGKTISYKEQAITLGNIKGIRAVASANGMNPVAIIVPCHRVIGQNGSLIGYAGGLWRKKFLLELESNQLILY